MSPPAAWKRRLRCGLVGRLMRSDGVRRAWAGSSNVSMHSDAHDAALSALAATGLMDAIAAGGVAVAVLRGMLLHDDDMLVCYMPLARRVAGSGSNSA